MASKQRERMMIERMMDDKTLSRRDLLRGLVTWGGAALLAACGQPAAPPTSNGETGDVAAAPEAPAATGA
ncbi:MAG: hypothetical protein MI924_20540, partial [Chloroflexales bacterium]|nr:hypothetical protein [Chloroflexales bacterium]